MDRVLVVGLDRPESDELRNRVEMAFVASPMLPKIKVERGELFVERAGAMGQYLPVSKVVYHGIFEDDFDFITGLALWRGPCLPGAVGMMNCRLKLPCLANALAVTKFASMPRGFALREGEVRADRESVAKWGNWHCGENKERFAEKWSATEATVVEDFIAGEAVRIMVIGEKSWQIALTGDSWKKSIHPDDARVMPPDPALLADTRRLMAHFGLEVCGVDYMIAADGTPHLLEVNHIPNVTRFEEVRAAYLNFAAEWIAR